MSDLTTVRPGTTVKVLHSGGASGTCLSAPTPVLAVTADRRRITTAMPTGCVSVPDAEGNLVTLLHPDYVLPIGA